MRSSEIRPPSWGVVEIILVYAGVQILTLLYGLLMRYFNIGMESEICFFSSFALVQFTVTILLVLFFSMTIRKARPEDLGMRGAGRDDLLKYGFLGGLLLALLMIGFGLLLSYFQPQYQPQLFEEVLRAAPDYRGIMLLLFLGVVVAPVSEEIFYRGMVYPVFRKHLGTLGGAVAAGIVFGLVHLDLWRAIPLAIGGTVLCLIYEKTGSIWVSAVSHGIWNAVMSAMVLMGIVLQA